MHGLLDVHWSLNLTRLHSWISSYIQMIKSRCDTFKLFIVMQLWDKCYINFKKINEITFQTTHLEVVLLYLELLYYEVTPPDTFPLRPILGVLQIGTRAKVIENQVMAASTIPVSAEENLGDPIDIRVDIIHPEPVAAVAFPAAAIVRTQAQHGEAIRGIQEHLLGVPYQEYIDSVASHHTPRPKSERVASIRTPRALHAPAGPSPPAAGLRVQAPSPNPAPVRTDEDFRKSKELR
ncbi:hypothetical protein Tco_0204631 [Tanacetum coccineum]